MLPYFEFPGIPIGPLRLNWFLLLLGSAILAGHFLFLRRAARCGLDRSVAASLNLAMVVAGLAGGALIGEPGGVSSQGLLFGGAIGAALYALARRMKIGELLRYADAGAFVFPWAWLVARLACVLAHDHPGIRSDNWLAVAYPGGGRWDLGLLEFLFTGLIAAVFWWLDRRPAPPYLSIFLVAFGLFRVALTTLRVDPSRYLGWPMEQWMGLAMALAGIAVLLASSRRPGRPA